MGRWGRLEARLEGREMRWKIEHGLTRVRRGQGVVDGRGWACLDLYGWDGGFVMVLG